MLKNKIGEKIKISYNSLSNEITHDIGFLFSTDDDFIVLKLENDLLKWIYKSKIVRIEEIK